VDAAFRGGPAAQGTFAVDALTAPGVPDGSEGSPVRVAKLDDHGSTLGVWWDTTTCSGANGYHVVYGFGADLPSSPGGTFALAGGVCGVDSEWTWTASPDPSSDPARLLWFLVLANGGATTEGPWGNGQQRRRAFRARARWGVGRLRNGREESRQHLRVVGNHLRGRSPGFDRRSSAGLNVGQARWGLREPPGAAA
jgi:hypothetical protein